jgi:hypothetical protein
MAFLILSKATTEIALKTQILGKGPYLSSFHLTRECQGRVASGQVAAVRVQAATGLALEWEAG